MEARTENIVATTADWQYGENQTSKVRMIKMNEVLTYEALKAERDALADKFDRLEYNLGNALIGEQETIRRADALAVENAGLKLKAAELVQEASTVYAAYNATIREPDGDSADFQTLHEMHCVIETPATDAALAAIEARVWAEAKDLAKSMLATDSADHIDFLFDGKIKQLREGK